MAPSTVEPIPLEGRSLVSVCVTISMLVLSTVVVCTRLKLRAWKARSSKMWDWDDMLALAGLVTFAALCALIIVGSCFGFGVPPSKLDNGHVTVGLKFFTVAEMTYCLSSACIKTSIGMALVRTICVQRRYRYIVWLTIALSTLAFLSAIVWFLATCRPVAASWDRSQGHCDYDGYIALVYVTFSTAVATDVAFASVPLLALRTLRMPRRTKYPLMAVLSLGSLAAVASVGRFPFVPGMYDRFSPHFLYQGVWIGMLSVLECGIGLIAGSMPFLGRLLHLYESNNNNNNQQDAANPYDPEPQPTIGHLSARVVKARDNLALFSTVAGTRHTAALCTKWTLRAKDDDIDQPRKCSSSEDVSQSTRET